MYRALHYSLSGADGFTKGATLSTRHRLATQGEGPIGRVRGAAATPARARTNRPAAIRFIGLPFARGTSILQEGDPNPAFIPDHA
jgi:hypothetical protein